MKNKKLVRSSRDPQFENKSPILYFVSTKRDKGNAEDHVRCIGYYLYLDIARSVVYDNAESLCEAGYYQYAIIEGFGPGWYPEAIIEEWYKFVNTGNTGKRAQQIAKPAKYSQICNFGIG